MKKEKKPISSKEALLCVLRTILSQNKQSIQYEDLIIEAHKRYPGPLSIKGYPKHPDSEVVSKRLYDLKRDGDITIQKRYIYLTEKGKVRADSLLQVPAAEVSGNPKLSRDVLTEIDRIKKTEVYHLFLKERLTEIVDTDLFSYLGTNVRADSTLFKGRLKTIEHVIKAVSIDNKYSKIVALHGYLIERFKDTISLMKGDRQ